MIVIIYGFSNCNFFVAIRALASKCSAKDTRQLLKSLVRILRLGFGGTLSKTFCKPPKADDKTNPTQSDGQKVELDQLISGMFLDFFVDINRVMENQKPVFENESSITSKTPLLETLLPVSKWLRLPADVHFQVLYL